MGQGPPLVPMHAMLALLPPSPTSGKPTQHATHALELWEEGTPAFLVSLGMQDGQAAGRPAHAVHAGKLPPPSCPRCPWPCSLPCPCGRRCSGVILPRAQEWFSGEALREYREVEEAQRHKVGGCCGGAGLQLTCFLIKK